MKIGRWLKSLRLPSVGGASGALAGLATREVSSQVQRPIAGVAQSNYQEILAGSPKPIADVATFALVCLEQAPGSAVDVASLYPGYCRYAQEMGQEAMPEDKFDRLWDILIKTAGGKVVRNGRKSYLEGVKLVA